MRSHDGHSVDTVRHPARAAHVQASNDERTLASGYHVRDTATMRAVRACTTRTNRLPVN